MRDDVADTVTPGGPPAPLGARTGSSAIASGRREAAPVARRAVLVVVLVAALAVYAALAADVVHGGGISDLDTEISSWVAASMPSWAEWLARPFTWLGGELGMAVIVVVAVVWLLRGGERRNAVLLVVVALGTQALVLTAKNGYERPRSDAGSAIELPVSYSFPSGHATTGVAVLGLLGLLLAAHAGTRSGRRAAIAAGFALGALVGASRVVLNVHYVSDVVAGYCLGLAWLCACLLVDNALRR